MIRYYQGFYNLIGAREKKKRLRNDGQELKNSYLCSLIGTKFLF